jgi:hypothetical protein
MSGGVVYQDLLPIPKETSVAETAENHDLSHTLRDQPTDSHALAMADHEVKGGAQQDHGEEVVDLGWNEPGHSMANPLIGGLPNDELWVLIRRFNKVRRPSWTRWTFG